MQPYATSTRTARNIDAMRRAGWRLLLTPDIDTDAGIGYAIDNGTSVTKYKVYAETKGELPAWSREQLGWTIDSTRIGNG